MRKKIFGLTLGTLLFALSALPAYRLTQTDERIRLSTLKRADVCGAEITSPKLAIRSNYAIVCGWHEMVSEIAEKLQILRLERLRAGFVAQCRAAADD